MTFKKILFGEEAMLALKKSKGERVVDGRIMLVEHDGRRVWAFVPYNRKPGERLDQDGTEAHRRVLRRIQQAESGGGGGRAEARHL